MFGKHWGSMKQPVKAYIAAIHPGSVMQVGLSATQLANLQLERKSGINAGVLMNMVVNNHDGKPDFNPYPQVKVSFGGKTVVANVYNAFGYSAIEDADGIRISYELAYRLHLSPSDTVTLSTE